MTIRYSLPAFFDEFEKIAISLDKIVNIGAPALESGIMGHRRQTHAGDRDTADRIIDRVRARGKKSWNPITKIKAHLAAKKLDQAKNGTWSEHNLGGAAVHEETARWAHSKPIELADRLKDPHGRVSTNVLTGKPHRWEYHTNHEGKPFQRPGTVWKGKGVPHPTVENQTAAAIAAAPRHAPTVRPSFTSSTALPAAGRASSTLPAVRQAATSSTHKIRPLLKAVS